MSISAEEKVCYLREAAIVLAKEGFQLDEVHTDRLCILLDGSPLCEVTESGGVAYRNKDIDEPERIAAKDKVYEIVRNTAEYMRQMETALHRFNDFGGNMRVFKHKTCNHEIGLLCLGIALKCSLGLFGSFSFLRL